MPGEAAGFPGGWPAKLGRFLEAMLVVCGLYLSANTWQWRQASLLPELGPDRWVPFMPWTVWIYASHLVFVPVNALALRGPDAFRRTLRAMAAAAALSFVVFVAYPTAVTRQVPVPPGATGLVFDFLFWINTPVNCVPSLHVSLVFLGALGARDDRRPWWPASLSWAAAIAASTMTTKEHYFIDVAGGVLTAAACRWLTMPGRWEWLAGRLLPSRPVPA